MPNNETNTNPPKCAIINLATQDRFDFQFNPTELLEQLSVEYERISGPGSTRQILQFKGVQNKKVPVQIYLSQFIREEEFGTYGLDAISPTVLQEKQWLESLTYPMGDGETDRPDPPDILFIWPRTIQIKGKVITANFRHQSFSSRTGETRRLVADLAIEEESEVRKIMRDVMSYEFSHMPTPQQSAR